MKLTVPVTFSAEEEAGLRLLASREGKDVSSVVREAVLTRLRAGKDLLAALATLQRDFEGEDSEDQIALFFEELRQRAAREGSARNAL